MTEKLFDVEGIRILAFKLSCAEQFRLATFVAENLGYVLKPEPSYDDPPPVRDAIAKVIDGVAFRPRHVSGEGLDETEKEKWLRARNVAYYKADQILAVTNGDR